MRITFFTIFPREFYIICQKIFQLLHFHLTNRFDFSHVCARVKRTKIFPTNIIPIYYCGIGAAQNRRGGSNRL
nr:MAG TPA: hypothetical protein [Caudoviricetes sp.]